MIDNQGISTGREVREMIQMIENELLENYKKHFKSKDKPLSDVNMNKWRDDQLKRYNKFKNSNRNIITKRTKAINRAILSDLEASYNFGISYVEKQVKDAKKQGFKPSSTYKAKSFRNNNRIKQLVHNMQQDVSRVLNNVIRDLDKRFNDTVSKVVNTVGAKTLYEAIDRANKPFLVGGVTGLVTKNGRHLNMVNHIELMTVEISQESLFHGEGEKSQEVGVDTVYITVHTTSCKLCTPWQGKILIDDVYKDGKPNGRYPLLSKAIQEGLYHFGCRHNRLTYIPNVDQKPPLPNDMPKTKSGNVSKKEQHEIYEKEQRQRQIERYIRKWKRVKNGALSKVEQDKASAKVRYWQKQRLELVRSTPQLYRSQYWRENPGFKLPSDKRYRELKKKQVI